VWCVGGGSQSAGTTYAVAVAAVRRRFPTLSLVRIRPPPSSAPCHQPPLAGATRGEASTWAQVPRDCYTAAAGGGAGASHLPLRKLASLMSLAVIAYVTRIGF
jgi:hypothetical protein